METLSNIITGLGIFTIVIFIIIAWLIWLFIRSAVASGTRQGFLEAYNEINKATEENEVKTEMFDNDEKSIIYILLLILVIGLIIAYMFFVS